MNTIMTRRVRIVSLVLVLLVNICSHNNCKLVSSFVIHSFSQKKNRVTSTTTPISIYHPLLSMSNSNNNYKNNNNDDDNDEKKNVAAAATTTLEETRQQLETLFKFNTNDNDNDNKSKFSSMSLMSTIGRERRKAEIALLRELEYNEDVTNEIWNLWYSERGNKAKEELQTIEELFDDRSQWSLAESRLKELIEYNNNNNHNSNHNIWVEPMNRLATLYYLQGRFEESKALSTIVLKRKPWHFGAISGLVMVCASLEEAKEARYWSTLRLPPLFNNKKNKLFYDGNSKHNNRRKQWVQRAVDDARKALLEEEERIRIAFGPSFNNYNNNNIYNRNVQRQIDEEKKKQLQQQQDDDDVWQ